MGDLGSADDIRGFLLRRINRWGYHMNMLDYKSAEPSKPAGDGSTNFDMGAFWCAVAATCFGTASCLSMDSPMFLLPGFLLIGCWLFGTVGAILAIIVLVKKQRILSILMLLVCLGIIFTATAICDHLDRPWGGLH
jgi:hypothetical protein